MKCFTSLTLTIISTTLLAGSVSVQAQNYAGLRHDEKSVTLSLNNLEPDNPVDASTLLKRIRSAARQACERNESGDRLADRRDFQNCLELGYQNAVASINTNRKMDLEAVAARLGNQPNIAAVSE